MLSARLRRSGLPARWAPSSIRRLLRRRGVWLAAAVALAAVSLSMTSSRLARLDDAIAAWELTETVVIVTRDVGFGSSLVDATELRAVPLAVVPDDAVRVLPERGVALTELFAGEVLVASRVSPAGTSLLGEGQVGVAIRVADGAALVQTGVRVDLYDVDTVTGQAARVAAGVRVIDRQDDEVTVAVDGDRVTELTSASLRPLVAVLVG